MRKFIRSGTKCPKCESYFVEVGARIRNRLHIVCEKCKYEWQMYPADYKEKNDAEHGVG